MRTARNDRRRTGCSPGALLILVAGVACERARAVPPAEPCPPLVATSFDELGTLAALWPRCPVDAPIESYAGRCLRGRHCMQPCRVERFDPMKPVPDDVQRFRYDHAGRLIAGRDESELGTLPPLELRCSYDLDGRPERCEHAAFATAFAYAGDHLAAIHETRDGAPFADEQITWDGDRIVKRTRTAADGAPGVATTYTYDDGRLVAVRSGWARVEKIALGYDDQGRVSQVVTEGGDADPTSVTLHYDADGRVAEQLEAVAGGIKRTTYRYEHERLVAELVAYGTLPLYRTQYVYDCR